MNCEIRVGSLHKKMILLFVLETDRWACISPPVHDSSPVFVTLLPARKWPHSHGVHSLLALGGPLMKDVLTLKYEDKSEKLK